MTSWIALCVWSWAWGVVFGYLRWGRRANDREFVRGVIEGVKASERRPGSVPMSTVNVEQATKRFLDGHPNPWGFNE